MERDDEINVSGGSYDFGARIYDSRIGRWLSLDNLLDKYPDISPYCGFANMPTLFVDHDGNEIIPTVLFTKTKMYNVVKNIVNALSISSTLSKYFSVYLGTSKDLHLSVLYQAATRDEQGNITGILSARYKGVDISNPSRPKSMVGFNPLSMVLELDPPNNDEHTAYVFTEIGLATSIIHEVIFHVSTNDAMHNISNELLFDAIEAIKEYSKNVLKIDLSNENAISLILSGSFPSLPNFETLLTAANTKYGTTLTRDAVIKNSTELQYHKEILTTEEVKEQTLQDPDSTSKVKGDDVDISGDAPPIKKDE